MGKVYRRDADARERRYPVRASVGRGSSDFTCSAFLQTCARELAARDSLDRRESLHARKAQVERADEWARNFFDRSAHRSHAERHVTCDDVNRMQQVMEELQRYFNLEKRCLLPLSGVHVERLVEAVIALQESVATSVTCGLKATVPTAHEILAELALALVGE